MSRRYVTELHEDMLARAREENHNLAVHADLLVGDNAKLRLELESVTKHSNNLAAALTTALAERDALRTLVGEINGRAQVKKRGDSWVAGWEVSWDALRDIRALCAKELKAEPEQVGEP